MKVKPIEQADYYLEYECEECENTGDIPYIQPRLSDVRKLETLANELSDALERAQEDINWMLNSRKFLNGFVFNYIGHSIQKLEDYNKGIGRRQ